MSAPTHELEVLAIGGSAGALDVLLDALRALPAELEVPVVVVLHLAPALPSLLPALLARAASRPVAEILDKAPLLRGAIHVAPPNYHALVERGGTLALSVDPPVRHCRPAIDVLFESCADAFGPAAAAVILSGANDDGAAGLLRIHRGGGIAIVESPATARYPAMPAAALAAVPGAREVPTAELGAFLGRLPALAAARPRSGGGAPTAPAGAEPGRQPS